MVWQFDLLRFGSLLTAFTLTAWLTKDATTERYVALFAGANAVAIIMQIQSFAISASGWRCRRLSCHAKHFARNGRWLALSSLLQLLSDQALLLVTAFIAGPFAAGAIKTCQTIVGIVNPVLMALEHTLPKKLGEDIRQQGLQRASATYRRLAGLTLFAMGAVLALVAIFAAPILHFVSGRELRGYEPLLQLCCALRLLYPLTLMISFVFRARDKSFGVLISQVLAAIFALVTGIPLILEIGAYGAVLGTIVAQVTAAISLVLMARRFAKFKVENAS